MASINRRLTFGASALALICATPEIISGFATNSLQSQIVGAGFSADAVTVTATGSFEIGGLKAAGISIGAVRSGPTTSLFAPAFAQASGYTIENVSLSLNAIKIDVPRIVVTGANFKSEDIAKVFVADKGMPERIRGLNAKSVSIPELRVTAAFPEMDSITYVMKNISADDLVNGKIARMLVEQTTYSAKGKGGSQSGTIKRTELRGTDLVQSARIYFATAEANEPMLPLYDSYVMDGMTSIAESNNAEVTMDFGKTLSNTFRARPLKTMSLAAAIADIAEQTKTQRAGNRKMSPEESQKTLRLVREIFATFEDDGMSVENIRFVVGEAAKPTVLATIAKAEGTYGNATKSSGFKISGVDIKAPDITAKLSEYSIEGFSYAPTFEGMEQAFSAGDTSFKSIDPRKLIPKLGTMRLKGMELDVPDPKAPKGIVPERIRAKLGTLSTAFTDQINGIPTKLDLVVENFAFQLPQTTADAGMQQLKALGYSAVDLSARLAAHWSGQNSQVAITELSFGGAEMGKVRVSANVANIGRDIFESDARAAQIALMGATAKSLVLQVENGGLAEKLIAMQARSQSRKPEDVRRELSGMASMVIPAMLGNSEEAKALAAAISGFVQRTKTLKIDVKAKSPSGIGLPDIMTVKDPQKALTLVDINATAGN